MEPGKAYGFFKCSAEQQAIEKLMPTVRHYAQTPSDLELKLDTLPNHKEGLLDQYFQQAHELGLNYVIEATAPAHTSEKTARELGDVLNLMYQAEELYAKDESYEGWVIYPENDDYLNIE